MGVRVCGCESVCVYGCVRMCVCVSVCVWCLNVCVGGCGLIMYVSVCVCV